MKLEKGYDTQLKEQGAGLSIGQRELMEKQGFYYQLYMAQFRWEA